MCSQRLLANFHEIKQSLYPGNAEYGTHSVTFRVPIYQRTDTKFSRNSPRQLQLQPTSAPAVALPTNPNLPATGIGFTWSSSLLGPTSTAAATTASPTVQQTFPTITSFATSSGPTLQSLSSGLALSSTSFGYESQTYSASSTPISPAVKNSTVHSPVFYVTVVILSVVSLIFLILFLLVLFAYAHRKHPRSVLRRKNRSQERQDLEAAGGAANNSRLKRETSEAGSEETVRVNGGNPGASFVGQTTSGYSTPGWRSEVASRPFALHYGSTATVRSLSQRLGPLQVNNYVEGDFPSSCDEDSHRSTQPRDNDSFQSHGTPGEADSYTTPRVADHDELGIIGPWAPLNINTNKSARQMVAQGNALEGSGMPRENNSTEKIVVLPFPHYSENGLFVNPLTYSNGIGDGGQGGWGETLRSSLYNAFSGITSGVPKPVNPDDAVYAPDRTRHSDSWIGKLSRYKRGSTQMASSASQASIEDNVRNSITDGSSGQWRAAKGFPAGDPSPVFQQLKADRVGEDDRNGAASLIPTKHRALRGEFVLSQARPVTQNGLQISETSICSTKYFPSSSRNEFESLARKHCSGRSRRASTACMGSSLTRRSTTSHSFRRQLRRAVSGSITSFSSEASDTATRDLTMDELRAKRIMQSRTRRMMGREDENVRLLMSTGSPNEQTIIESRSIA